PLSPPSRRSIPPPARRARPRSGPGSAPTVHAARTGSLPDSGCGIPAGSSADALQPQSPGVERDRLPDVLVPVGPVMPPREFLVLVRDVKRLQMRVERPVLVYQEIVRAAIDPQRGDAAVVDSFDQGERVFGAPGRRPAEDPVELRESLPGPREIASQEADGPRVGVH